MRLRHRSGGRPFFPDEQPAQTAQALKRFFTSAP